MKVLLVGVVVTLGMMIGFCGCGGGEDNEEVAVDSGSHPSVVTNSPNVIVGYATLRYINRTPYEIGIGVDGVRVGTVPAQGRQDFRVSVGAHTITVYMTIPGTLPNDNPPGSVFNFADGQVVTLSAEIANTY